MQNSLTSGLVGEELVLGPTGGGKGKESFIAILTSERDFVFCQSEECLRKENRKNWSGCRATEYDPSDPAPF